MHSGYTSSVVAVWRCSARLGGFRVRRKPVKVACPHRPYRASVSACALESHHGVRHPKSAPRRTNHRGRTSSFGVVWARPAWFCSVRTRRRPVKIVCPHRPFVAHAAACTSDSHHGARHPQSSFRRPGTSDTHDRSVPFSEIRFCFGVRVFGTGL